MQSLSRYPSVTTDSQYKAFEIKRSFEQQGFNLHKPERYPQETQSDYRLRQKASKFCNQANMLTGPFAARKF